MFLITIASDSKSEFTLAQKLEIGTKSVDAEINYKQSGNDYNFWVETDNNWGKGWPAKLKISENIEGNCSLKLELLKTNG